MLPTISFSALQEDVFKSLRLVGDLAFQAGELSIELLEAEVGDLGKQLGLDRDVVAKALLGQNVIGIPASAHGEFLKLAFHRQQYKRAIITRVVKDYNDFDFTPFEKLVVTTFLESAHLFDELFYAWREQMVESELGRKAQADPAFMTKFRAENGLSLSPYTFSVVAQKDGKYYEQSLPEAYPETVAAIVTAYQALHDGLQKLDAPEYWTAYMEQLVSFFKNTDVAHYESISKELDRRFLAVEGRLVPFHAVEVYDDPGKYCVTPEMRLCVVDDRYVHVNEGIERTRTNVMSRLTTLYDKVPALQKSLPLMKRAQAAAYTTLSEAGASMTLRPFGENVPNWDDIRARVGVRIFIFMETAKTRWVGERTVLRKILGDEAVATYFDPHTASEQFFDYAGIVAVGGHEIAHNAFVTEGVSERLTPPLYAKVEEHKANLAILSQIDSLYSVEEQQIIALYELGYSLMKMAQIDDPTVVAYVNYAMFAVNTFMEAGVLQKTADGFALDMQPQKVDAWVKLLKTALDDLVPIYDHGTPAEADAYIKKYFVRSPIVDELVGLLA